MIAVLVGTVVGTLAAAFAWEWVKGYAADRRRRKRGFGRKPK